MNKLSIMLVDTDERYLMPIELKFIEELEDKIDIIVISDEGYLKEYFSTPRNIDILVINENLYSYEFEKHNIGNTFILTEKESQVGTENLSLHSIYNYILYFHFYHLYNLYHLYQVLNKIHHHYKFYHNL